MRQLTLDTETTGLLPEKGHRIIEIGVVEIIKRQITNNNFRYNTIHYIHTIYRAPCRGARIYR